MRRHYRRAAGLLLAVSLAFLTGCQAKRKPRTIPLAPQPASRPAATEPAYSVSAMRVQKVDAAPFFYVATHTNLRTIGTAIDRAIPALDQARREGHVISTGPVTFVYLGATEDPGKMFELQIGVRVGSEAKSWGDFRVRQLDAIRAASVIYIGPMSDIGKAYDKLIPDMVAAGLTPSPESREVYLDPHAPDSRDNIVQVQVGIR